MRGIALGWILLVSVASLAAQGNVSLRGIPSVLVTVVDSSRGTGSCAADSHPLESLGIDVTTVLTETQYKLREAGVKIPEAVSGVPYLPSGTLNLTIGLIACGRSMHVGISLWEWVTVRGVATQAITWNSNGGQYGGASEAYRSLIRDGVTSFLNAWLRDNK